MLLQSLVYSFQADTRDIDKGIKKTEKGADDLTNALKKSEEQSKKTSQTLGMFAKAAIGWLGAAASAGKAMSMAIQRAGEVDALDTLSLQLGASITKTDALARSIVGLGGSTDQAQADLGRLSDALKDRGQKPLEGMLQLSDRLAGMSYDQATRELKEYGITEKSTIELMRKGSGEIQRMIKHQERNGAITQEAADKAKQFNQSLTRLKLMSSDAANKFAQMLIPALTVVVDFLAKAGKWASENKPFVVGFFAAVASIIGVMFLPAMLSAAAATLAATWPFIAIGAAIGAAAAMFALIYDDIMNFIDGGESMIGMVLDKFPIIGEIVTFVADIIKTAFSMLLQTGEALWSGFTSMADGIVGVFQWLWEGIKKYIDFIGGAVEKIKGALSWVASKLGFGEIEVKSTQEDKDFAKRFAIKSEPEDSLAPVKPERKKESREENTARFDTTDVSIGRTTDTAEPRIDKEVAEPRIAQDVDIAKKSVEPRLDRDVDRAKKSVEPRLDQDVIAAQVYIKAAEESPAASMTTGSIRNAATGNNIEQNLAIGEITIETQATDAQGMASSTRSELQEQLQRMQANNATAITR